MVKNLFTTKECHYLCYS